MSDMARAAQAAASLIDKLESELDDDETVGDLMLISEVRTADGGSAYMRCHCTEERFIVQMGMIAWAHSALSRGQDRVLDDHDDDEDKDDGEA